MPTPEFNLMSIGLLGTTFTLRNPGSDWHALKPRLEGVLKLILQHTGVFIRRQKRPFVAYWDAITYLHSRVALDGAEPSKDHGLILELTTAMRDGADIYPRPVLELVHHAVIKNARSILVHYRKDTQAISPHGLMRGLSARNLMNVKGRVEQKKAGFYREFELDLADQAGKAASLDVMHVMELAVLVQLKADLEVYYETGFRRLRCCDNHRCNAWFTARAMGSRQRFCSTFCRVQASREAT